MVNIMEYDIKKRALTLYRKNNSLRKTGEILGINHETVRSMLPRNEICPNRLDRKTINKVLILRREGYSYKDIMKIMGFNNRQKVYRIVTQYGNNNR